MQAIYVTIACYRDQVIQSTIDDLFNKADNADRVSVGVFIQELASEAPLITNTYGGRVKVTSQEPGQIFSVCECRNKALEHYSTQEYTLQIDSHTRFDQGWDTYLINLHSSLDNCKSLISIYLPDWYLIDNQETIVPRKNLFPNFSFNTAESEKAFHTYNELVPFPVSPISAEGELLKRGWYLCGHFIFGPSEFFQTIPQPEWVGFWGEEVINSVRAFTSGWDVYIPASPPLYHMHEAKSIGFSRPKLWLDFPIEHSNRRMPTTDRIIDTIKNKVVSKEDLFSDRDLENLYDITEYNLGTLFEGWKNDRKLS